MFKTVLFPIDQTRESRHAAEIVVSLLNSYDGKLIILSVVEPPDPESEQDPEMSSPAAIAKLLDTAKTLFKDQGIDAETIEKQGNPAFVICDVADELDVDLIVMGSRGADLTNVDSAEGVSNRVINLSPCPVLVVP
ncbi:MAG: universal stress protein [Leptolyngbyaceae bacterium]|nr:universal stress protein [Leptolyngbyaceae bacterium]